MRYDSELAMYPDVCGWLKQHLESRSRVSDVRVFDSHSIALNQLIRRQKLQSYFDDGVWQTFDIQVDIVGVFSLNGRPKFVFVECKNKPLSLLDLAQLLGYCRIARPYLAFLLSPSGPGGTLRSLILTYGRTDTLEYDWPKKAFASSVIAAKWDRKGQALDPASVLPRGAAY